MNSEIHSIMVFLKRHLGKSPWRILEAGCGSISHLPIPENATVVGIDISHRQLERNTRLNESIMGDIQVFPIPREQFDLIVCWDVLEHLPDPKNALLNLFQAIRPGGVIILAFPNLFSLKGLVTRFTPFIVHLWFYRYIIGDKRRHEEMDQFPTYLKLASTPRQITELAKKNGLEVSRSLVYEGPVQHYLRSRNKAANLAFGLLERLCSVLTLRQWNPNLSDCLMLLEKPQAMQGEPS